MSRSLFSELSETFFILMNTPLIPPEQDKSKSNAAGGAVQLTDFSSRRRSSDDHSRRSSNDSSSLDSVDLNLPVNFVISDVEEDFFVNRSLSSPKPTLNEGRQ